jgi:hypothetical protein
MLYQVNGILAQFRGNIELLAQQHAPDFLSGIKSGRQKAITRAARELASGDVNWEAIQAAATVVAQLPTLFHTGGIAAQFPASAFGINKTVVTRAEHELLVYSTPTDRQMAAHTVLVAINGNSGRLSLRLKTSRITEKISHSHAR